MNYLVNIDLDYPATEADLAACQAGNDYARHVAAPGDVVDDIPEVSLPWLLDAGYITPVDVDAPASEATP
jgi:hypothetical protein